MMSLMNTYKLKQSKRIWISLIVGVLYASSDEIHQAFVPGRGPMLTDVLIDTSGVVTGIILVICIFKMYKIITNNSKITAKTTKCNN